MHSAYYTVFETSVAVRNTKVRVGYQMFVGGHRKPGKELETKNSNKVV